MIEHSSVVFLYFTHRSTYCQFQMMWFFLLLMNKNTHEMDHIYASALYQHGREKFFLCWALVFSNPVQAKILPFLRINLCVEKSQANWALLPLSYNWTYNSTLHLHSIINSLSLHSLTNTGHHPLFKEQQTNPENN